MSLPMEFKRGYNRKWEQISLLEFVDNNTSVKCHSSISRRGSAFEIRCTIKRKPLQRVLETLSPLLEERDPCLKILCDSRRNRVLEITLGDSKESPGIDWLPLDKDR
jgi:hypothetical protein